MTHGQKVNLSYFMLVCVLVSFTAGFALFWSSGREARTAAALALALGLIGVAAMMISESLYSSDPLIPETCFEWLYNLQYVAIITLSFVVGHLLARALRAATALRRAISMRNSAKRT